MKNALTIQFASLEDLAYAQKMISLTRERTKGMAPYGGTPLQGAQASILLCALGRSLKTKSPLTDEQAKDIRLGKPCKQ